MSYPINRLTQSLPVQKVAQKSSFSSVVTSADRSFKRVFEEKLKEASEIKFSAHAQERLRTRNIPFGQGDMDRLKAGVQELVQKGGRESLVLLDQSAFLVNVQNRTVITAIGNESLRNNVFTNIDSAVIV